ncbi:hypothetical protein DMC30DRAFT_414287 [Rhodotorula diobovata]|uniref:Uncharacterized protein n=1 Tax=Rhodotorula diobovata TaxID=5288 RepID=A0A5C5G2U2_9BASI|nr:hypothetical protein DMC30DRAFT_414287 [Rhodotorula diobovata]
MHQRLETEDSLLEADGLAAFTARFRPSSPHDWRESRSSRSTAYRYSPPFSPASEFPYSPPPLFASAEPQAVVSPFDDGDTDLCDSRGDLGTPGWSQSPADDERATDAASDKGLAYSSGALKGEWHAPAGAYLHGVGFDDAHAHGAVAGAQPGSKTSLAALERRRERLARKFGSSAASGPASERGRKSARTEEEELTGVDAYGRLVTQGRRKRVFLRCAQAGCALLVGVGAIGAAFTRPVSTPDHPVPAPKGSAPHWALIIIPFLSLALTTYLFAARPCLYRRRREQQDAQGPFGGGGVGGSGRTALSGLFPLVQPALQGPPQRQGWFGGGSSPRPGPGGPHGGGMSVNLVVDPRFLPGFGGFDGVHAVAGDAQRREKNKAKRRRRRRRMREERRRAAAQRDSVEGADLVSTDGNPQGRTNPRRALFSHLAHESTWRAARSFAKRVAVADFACCVLWGAVGAWAIGWAGGCKPGEGEGFCDLFNTAEAFAIMSSVAFAASFTLGCFDLSRAKLSPRLRQQRLAGAV